MFFVNFISLKKFFTLSNTNLKLPLSLSLHLTLDLPKSEIIDSAFFSLSICLFFFPHLGLPFSESVISSWVVAFRWSWLTIGGFRSAQVGFRSPWVDVGSLVLMGGHGFARHHLGLPLFELVISGWVVAFWWSWLVVGGFRSAQVWFRSLWACGYGFAFRSAQVGFRKWICFGFFFFFFLGLGVWILVVVDVDGGSGGRWFGFWIWILDFVWVFWVLVWVLGFVWVWVWLSAVGFWWWFVVVVVGGVGDCSGCWWWFQFVGMDFLCWDWFWVG